jgi:hypothetical protein
VILVGGNFASHIEIGPIVKPLQMKKIKSLLQKSGYFNPERDIEKSFYLIILMIKKSYKR